MNFITTNIRIPEDVYNEIKLEAFEKKKSFGAIARERLSNKKKIGKFQADDFINRINKFAKENSGKFYGKSSEQIIREMRDE